MTIKTTQKVIKVGDSLAITIPAKVARANGISAGKSVDATIKLAATDTENTNSGQLDAEYEAFKKQYGAALNNLAQR